jgi:ssDNA-binding Zn-finger/Zn-ribbon topoisomerase 1
VKEIETYKQEVEKNPDDAEAHYNLGVAYVLSNDRNSALEQYEILKNLDNYLANLLFGKMNVTPKCPECGAATVLRTARRGKYSGNQFYGCLTYPRCKGTVNLSEVNSKAGNSEKKDSSSQYSTSFDYNQGESITLPRSLQESKAIYKTLSVSEVQSMPNVSIRNRYDWGFFGHSTINHDYNLKAVGGDKVVVDNTTGLMWHQSGSRKYMNYKKAMKWISKLNKSGYASYQDWRLPTIDEAASLLEPSRRNGLYIDPVFSKKQKWIWTGDKTDYGSEAAWFVRFYDGNVYRGYILYNCYVRLVRSDLSNDSGKEPEEEVYEEEMSARGRGTRRAREEKLSKTRITNLRSSYKKLSVSEVQSMPNVSIREEIHWGFYGHSTISHDYNLKAIKGDKVVVDNTTGLMWHQGGSGRCFTWADAKGWIESLNNEEGYAGYHDWRLPTVDEAASLLESSKKNGDLYIDPVFSKNQKWIWTGDKCDYVFEDGSETAWRVGFNNGGVSWDDIYNIRYYCVRSVRSAR